MAPVSLQKSTLQALTARAEAAEQKEKAASDEAESQKKEVAKLSILVNQVKACGIQPYAEEKNTNTIATRCRSWLIAHLAVLAYKGFRCVCVAHNHVFPVYHFCRLQM